MSSQGSITVPFSNTSTSSSVSTELELDDDYHVSLYSNDKTEFYRTDIVYLKIKPTYDTAPYTIQTSEGSCIRSSKNNVEEITELVAFTNSKTAQLSYLPIGNVSFTWKTGSGTPLVSGRNITLPAATIGILACVYSINFDRLKLTMPATYGGATTSALSGTGNGNTIAALRTGIGFYAQIRENAATAISLDCDVAVDTENNIDILTVTHDINQTAAAAITHTGQLINYTSTMTANNTGATVTKQTDPLFDLDLTITATLAGDVAAMTTSFIHMSLAAGGGA
jgi:hypothetical protein